MKSIVLTGKIEIGVAEPQSSGKENLRDKIFQEVLQPPKPKKSKLMDHETEETKNLSTTELQRLVLLEQLQLIRSQKELIRLQKEKVTNGILLNFSEENII